jgi:hypothetical protein
MKKYLGLILLLCCWLPVAQAATVRQHSATGIVSLLDRQTGRLLIVPVGEQVPLEIQIVRGRTKLRCDGRAAQISELTVGESVQIFFRTEVGKNVAVQIRWKSERPKS